MYSKDTQRHQRILLGFALLKETPTTVYWYCDVSCSHTHFFFSSFLFVICYLHRRYMALWCHYQQSISLRMYVRERALGIKSDDYSICLLLCTYIVHSKTIQLQLNRKLRFYFVFSIRLSVLFELCSLHQTDNEILECSICDYCCLCLIMDKSCVCVCVGVYIGIYTHQAKKKGISR